MRSSLLEEVAPRWRGSVLAVALFVALAGAARADTGIGRVKTIEGPVYVERDGYRGSLAAGDRLMVGDWIETGGSGSVGIAFRDNTMVSIGPETRILLREYAFAPAEGKLAFALDLARGTLVYISGIIAKLLPEGVEVKTPASTVAVRGTRFIANVEPES